MTAVSFSIPGRIGGKGRPRFARAGKFVRTYTDAKTLRGEALVRQLASLAMSGRPLLEGPLALTITISVQPPPSWSRKKRAAAMYLTGKPDCDNQQKLISDAMNNVVYFDDSQICDVRFSRRYDANAPEAVTVIVQPLTGIGEMSDEDRSRFTEEYERARAPAAARAA